MACPTVWIFFRILVGDGELEFILELHHQLDGIQRVGVEVIDKMGLARDFVLVDAHLLADDFLNLLLDIFHSIHLP